jgi:hypothetical protein
LGNTKVWGPSRALDLAESGEFLRKADHGNPSLVEID